MDSEDQRATAHSTDRPQTTVSMRRPGFRVRESPVWRDFLLRRMLFAADVVACAIAAGSLGIGHESGYHVTLWALIAAPIWLLAAKLFGLYDADHRSLRHLTADELPTLAAWALTCAAATTLVLLASPYPPGVDLSLQSFLVRLGAVFVLRATARWAWRRYTPPARTLLVGGESRSRTIARKLELFPDTHLQVVARIDRLGVPEIDAPGFLRDFDRVIVIGETLDEDALHHLIRACKRARVKVSVVTAGPPQVNAVVAAKARAADDGSVRVSTRLRVSESGVLRVLVWSAKGDSLRLDCRAARFDGMPPSTCQQGGRQAFFQVERPRVVRIAVTVAAGEAAAGEKLQLGLAYTDRDVPGQPDRSGQVAVTQSATVTPAS